MTSRSGAPAVVGDIPLPDADFSDSYSVQVAEPLDALQAARQMVGRRPRWVDVLLMLRNLAVTPFGLKRGAPTGAERIGIFSVVSASPDRVVMGFDDVHLDFRVVVDVAPEGSRRQVTATTFVRTRNRLGRLYLAAVKPFHRAIVPAMLAQVGGAEARSLSPAAAEAILGSVGENVGRAEQPSCGDERHPDTASHNDGFVEMCIDLPAGWQGTPAPNRLSAPPEA